MLHLFNAPSCAVNQPAALRAAYAAVEGLMGRLQELRDQTADTPFVDLENAWLDEVAKLETLGLAALLEGCLPESEEVEHDGEVYRRVKEPTQGVYFGLRGKAEVVRPLYRMVGVRNGPTIDPIALRAGLHHVRMTPAATKATGMLYQAMPSREAKRAADAAHVLPYSSSSLYRFAEDLGSDWEAQRLEGEEYVALREQIPEATVAISVSVDRVSLPMKEEDGVNYRMAWCGCLTFHDAEGEPLHTIRYGRRADGGRKDLVFTMKSDLQDACHAKALKVVALGDGAHEIQDVLDEITEGQRVSARLVDFWHFTEKLAAAARGAGEPVGPLLKAFKDALLNKERAVDAIEPVLRRWEMIHADAPGVHEAITYIENHRERLRYAEARAAKLPIGSGAVEATCKTLVTVRMKRSGARWKPEGAQALLNLRALALSDRWDHAIAFLEEQRRRQVTERAAA